MDSVPTPDEAPPPPPLQVVSTPKDDQAVPSNEAPEQPEAVAPPLTQENVQDEHAPVIAELNNPDPPLQKTREHEDEDLQATHISEPNSISVQPPPALPLNLLDRIEGLYPLLVLVHEEGSESAVDKVIIDHKSVGRLANVLHQGSYRPEYQFDFKALDKHVIKPLGIYGSTSAIIKFLHDLGKIDQETYCMGGKRAVPSNEAPEQPEAVAPPLTQENVQDEHAPVIAELNNPDPPLQKTREHEDEDLQATHISEPNSISVQPPPALPLNLLDRIEGLYPLLVLVHEEGSESAVDKVIIDHKSVGQFANVLHQGSYRPEYQLDFKVLDQHVLKPLGVYGSMSAIVKFLRDLGKMDHETSSLLMSSQDEQSKYSRPTLTPGLYLLDSRHIEPGLVHIIFWPEYSTWTEDTTSLKGRNRVTFMSQRYLTKLCDQLVCVISDEDSEKIVWKEVDPTEKRAAPSSIKQFDRLFSFTVEEINEEVETAKTQQGFMIKHPSIKKPPESLLGFPPNLPIDILASQIVVGDTSQALLEVEFQPEKWNHRETSIDTNGLALPIRLSRKDGPNIVLSEDLDRFSLDMLLKHGLWPRCGNLEQEWNDELKSLEEKRTSDRIALSNQRQKDIDEISDNFKRLLPIALIEQTIKYFPTLSGHRDVLKRGVLENELHKYENVDPDAAYQEVMGLIESHQLVKEKAALEDLKDMEESKGSKYSIFKQNLRYAREAVSTMNLSPEDIQKLVESIDQKGKVKKWFSNLVDKQKSISQQEPTTSGNTNSQSTVAQIWSKIAVWKKTGKLPPEDDMVFLASLDPLTETLSELKDVADGVKTIVAREILRTKIKKMWQQMATNVQGVLQKSKEDEIAETFDRRQSEEDTHAWKSLQERINAHLASERQPDMDTLTILKVSNSSDAYASKVQTIPGSYGTPEMQTTPQSGGARHKQYPNTQQPVHLLSHAPICLTYKFDSLEKACLKFTLRRLEIKQDDLQLALNDKKHICWPTIRPSAQISFSLPLGVTMRGFRLVGNDRCLMVTEDSTHLRIYIKPIASLETAIANNQCKELPIEKVGRGCLFAFDESKRLFALLNIHAERPQLRFYVFNPDSNSLVSYHQPFNVDDTKSSDHTIFTHLTFITGKDELLISDINSRCLIFSINAGSLRPCDVQLNGKIVSVSSTPEGACVFVKMQVDGASSIRCLHLASFGEHDGIEIPWPDNIPANSPMAISSVGHRSIPHLLFLDVENAMSSNYSFQSENPARMFGYTDQPAWDNLLISCHAEVWTRFPVRAAITSPSHQFEPYFRSLIQVFQDKTKKPTGGVLEKIKVSASTTWNLVDGYIKISELLVGEWFVEMFCLIPIHIAITKSNHFIPLKDGMISPHFEKSLLGAHVSRISDLYAFDIFVDEDLTNFIRISFGWYESIFSSSLAKKPVKVVTSMGEQSVGKSFTLNHLLDTSFAGSAMRCTEGVWLSVTPTRDYLAVAIDFEGVHSIERTAQEDMLLVLLNTAISNLVLVLFRNNFSISRDIAGLFTSFQSSSNVLDPAANPNLFNSHLAIIIKDVVDGDKREIVQEFQKRFQGIVREERGNNFITKLHRGRVNIIPWPVIESPQFYVYFDALKMKLDEPSLGNLPAGIFLVTLKMLMAKLKANDWGALDSNLAIHRAEQLSPLLTSAICFGLTDPTFNEPLKASLLAPKALKPDEDGAAIFFLDAPRNDLLPEPSLHGCLQALCLGYPKYKERFQMEETSFFSGLLLYLDKLVDTRLQHVSQWLIANTERFAENGEISLLNRTFEAYSKDSISSTPTGMTVTHHIDVSITVNLSMNMNPVRPQNAIYLALELHIYVDIRVNCIKRKVAYRLAARPLDTMMRNTFAQLGCIDAARLVALSSLMEPGSVPDHVCSIVDWSMTGTCVTDLCHAQSGANSNPVDLSAKKKIIFTLFKEMLFIFAVRAIGVQNYASRKYTQIARQLPCKIPIPPGELQHPGPHLHSQDPALFHYCTKQCHKQNEHETSHGSMAQTKWMIDGDGGAYVELDGHKYATGDSGAPMLCNMLCGTLGRHVHIDTCLADTPSNCNFDQVQHIDQLKGYDWITHELFWKRSDPYSNKTSSEFKLWTYSTVGENHKPELNPDARPSFCTLPLFHKPADGTNAPSPGHVSVDGHAYTCKNPADIQSAFHIIFVLDRSGSMSLKDHQPMLKSDVPITQDIAQRANNRFGAVVASLYEFWTSRELEFQIRGTSDAYTVITFNKAPTVLLSNDMGKNPSQLVELVLDDSNKGGGTNFDEALKTARSQMTAFWSKARSPVLIFLSDGECEFSESIMTDLCWTAANLGKPLSVHTISFGTEDYSQSLRRMVAIAAEKYASATRETLSSTQIEKICTYRRAPDSIELLHNFTEIGESLKNRAALVKIRSFT
ncbi:hypothetical protein CPB86DRAFT_797339 [Serendipita vermifera]|nr:hypothetical protein CPB86DRAFT_797339 [Serendipita vermifera]